MKFIDYFRQAIRKQFMRDKAELVKKLGMLNANPKCKKLLLALPPEPEPTLIQMIEACNFLGMSEYWSTLQAQAMGQGVTEALVALEIISKRPQQQGLVPCHQCREQRLFRKDCPQ